MHLASVFIDNEDENQKCERQHEIGVEIHHSDKKSIDHPQDNSKYDKEY